MVVVEGVARSLNPTINIWKVAQPIVEDYIRQNVGPRALARDLARTVRVLARFGPKLPQLAEAALIRQTAPEPPPPPRRQRLRDVAFASLGAAAGAAAVLAALWH
jgi:ubiquinone biosynthesis protein